MLVMTVVVVMVPSLLVALAESLLVSLSALLVVALLGSSLLSRAALFRWLWCHHPFLPLSFCHNGTIIILQHCHFIGGGKIFVCFCGIISTAVTVGCSIVVVDGSGGGGDNSSAENNKNKAAAVAATVAGGGRGGDGRVVIWNTNL
jgi:hypothetical protein